MGRLEGDREVGAEGEVEADLLEGEAAVVFMASPVGAVTDAVRTGGKGGAGNLRPDSLVSCMFTFFTRESLPAQETAGKA